MIITWYGHACFKIETDGYSVVIDPFTGVPGYDELHLEANCVVASHGHFDHNYFDAVTLTPAPEEKIRITKVPSFHDNCGGTERGVNTIHLLEGEGMKVVHLGDLGHLLNEEQLALVHGCEVLLVPVGGFYTIDATMAHQVCDQIQPRIIVPMHFRFDGKGLEKVGGVEPFLAYYNEDFVRSYPDGQIEVTKDTSHQVALLK